MPAKSRRPSMSDRIDGAATGTVTPINRGRDAFTAEATTSTTGTPMEIPIARIDPSPDNPRSTLGDLAELAASIKELGILQPLLVRTNGDRYDLIYGHRRLAAAKQAKRKVVPAFLAVDDDETRDHTRRLVENLHREDLTALDEARGYEQLLSLGVAAGQRGLAKMVGKSQAHVSKRLRLLQLPDKVQAKVDSGGITVGDALELAKLADEPERLKKALKAGDRPYGGRVGAAVRRQVDDMEQERARQASADQLRAAGVKVIDSAGHRFDRTEGPYPLRNLPVDEADHAKLGCHAAALPNYGSTLVFVCTDPQSHLNGHDTEAAERAELEAASLAAAEARRDFTRTLVRKGAPDAGAGVLIAQVVGDQDYYLRVEDELVAQILGLAPDTFNGKGHAAAIRAFADKGTRNAQRAVYAVGLALGEMAISGGEARDTARRAYLAHLVAAGYTLSEFEEGLLAEATDDLDADDYDDDEHEGSE